MILMAASWPSKREAAVTIRTLFWVEKLIMVLNKYEAIHGSGLPLANLQLMGYFFCSGFRRIHRAISADTPIEALKVRVSTNF